LYLGQARALGAVGVLPKQIKPADVSKVLYQLHLVADRRITDQTSFTPVITGGDGQVEIMPPQTTRPLTDAGLREQLAELRRALLANLDSQAERIEADVRSMLLEGQPPPPPRPPPAAWAPWIVAAAAVLIGIGFAALWWQAASRTRALETEVTALRADVSDREKSAAASGLGASGNDSAAAAGFTAAAGQPSGEAIVARVPYGEEPLSGQRFETLRELFQRLAAEDFAGTVEVTSYPGRFCLVGNAAEGYSVAPDESLFNQCDLVGNPRDEAAPERISLALANLIGNFRRLTQNQAEVRVSTGDAATTVSPYPAQSDDLSAGEWNRAARVNNRVEIRVR
jgi:hypothetical protein